MERERERERERDSDRVRHKGEINPVPDFRRKLGRKRETERL